MIYKTIYVLKHVYLILKPIKGSYKTKTPAIEQTRKYKRYEKEFIEKNIYS